MSRNRQVYPQTQNFPGPILTRGKFGCLVYLWNTRLFFWPFFSLIYGRKVRKCRKFLGQKLVKIRVPGVSFFCKFVKFWEIFGKFSGFKPEETLEFPNFGPGDARGRPRGSPRGSPGPHFSRKSLFSSAFTVCTRLKKSVHTGVHTGIFRHFDPKKQWFDPCSFFVGCAPRGRVTGVPDTPFWQKHCFLPDSHFARGCKKCTPGCAHRHFSTFRP